MKFWLIIPAAGVGSRMQADCPKQYLRVAGKSILDHTLGIFLRHPQLQQIVLPLAVHDRWWQRSRLADDLLINRVEGGEERADSVMAGFRALLEVGAAAEVWVLVPDDAGP